jgi:AcrR family transcriptional regulator
MVRDADSNTRGGRPRNPAIDEIVRRTTADLLADEGYEATTVQEISRRSGVQTSAIYRRWPTRVALIQDVAFPFFREVRVHPTGDLRRDLRRFVTAWSRQYSTPTARAAMPGLVAAYQRDEHTPPEEWLRISLRPQLGAILDAAPPGQVDPDLDRDDIFDLLLGSMLVRMFVPTVTDHQRSVDRTVELVLRLVRPVGR